MVGKIGADGKSAPRELIGVVLAWMFNDLGEEISRTEKGSEHRDGGVESDTWTGVIDVGVSQNDPDNAAA